MDVIKHMTKENFKEKSKLFPNIQRTIFEKVNFKLDIKSMTAKLETFAVEKKMFPNEKFDNEEKTHTLSTERPTNSENDIVLTERSEVEQFIFPLKNDGFTPGFK